MKQKTTLLPDWKKDKKLPQETINDIIENPKNMMVIGTPFQ